MMRQLVPFGDLKPGQEFLFEKQPGSWVRFRKIVSPGAVLGEDFAEMNAIQLGGSDEAVLSVAVIPDVALVRFCKT